jgi:hypothetical protein
MNDQAVLPLTRDQIRQKLVGDTPAAKRIPLHIFDCDIELKQPDLKSILKARDESDPAKRSAEMIIQYAVMPGTDENVFEDSDLTMILRWPFGEDMVRLNEAISELTGVDLEKAEEELEASPLAEPS